jgi:hypothetical protein
MILTAFDMEQFTAHHNFRHVSKALHEICQGNNPHFPVNAMGGSNLADGNAIFVPFVFLSREWR